MKHFPERALQILARAEHYKAIADSRGIKFRRKDLKRLEAEFPLPEGSIFEVLKHIYGYSFDLIDGKIIIEDPIKWMIPDTNPMLAILDKPKGEGKTF